MPRVLVLALGVAFLAACGGSGGADRGAQSPTAQSTAETTAGSTTAEELLYGCIEPDTAEGLKIESNGVELDAAVYGDGPVGIVLGHESDGSLCNWASTAPDLEREGVQVLVFDFGDPAGVVGDMRRAIQKVRELGAKRIVVGGASLGGTVALVTAARERDVIGAFTLSAPAVFGNVDGVRAVRRFRAPVLFVAADDDANFADAARQLYGAAVSRDRKLVLVSGSEHGTALYAGEEADRVRTTVATFLAKVSS